MHLAIKIAPFYENYAKLYFDAEHLGKGLNRGCWNFLCCLSCQCWVLPYFCRFGQVYINTTYSSVFSILFLILMKIDPSCFGLYFRRFYVFHWWDPILCIGEFFLMLLLWYADSAILKANIRNSLSIFLDSDPWNCKNFRFNFKTT